MSSQVAISCVAVAAFSLFMSLAGSPTYAAQSGSGAQPLIINAEVQGKKMMLAQMDKDGGPVVTVLTRVDNPTDGSEQLFQKITAVLLGSGYHWKGSEPLDTSVVCKVGMLAFPEKGAPVKLMADVGCGLKMKSRIPNEIRVMRVVYFTGIDLDAGVKLIPGLIAEAYAEATKLVAK